MAARVLGAVLDLLYPPRCAACGEGLRSTAEEPFCPVCREAVDAVPPGCRRCGLPGPDALCGGCHADPPAFTSLAAGGLFGGPLADAVHALKYGGRPALARPLGAWLAHRTWGGRSPAYGDSEQSECGTLRASRGVSPASEAAKPAAASAASIRAEGAAAGPQAALLPGARAQPSWIVAVPLGRRRRLDRGYDQAALLARSLARSAPGARFLPGALVRTRETAPQVGRTRTERLGNVRGAFRGSPAVQGRDVVLVDDVVTTGATARACAEALLAAGARSVRVLALARAD